MFYFLLFASSFFLSATSQGVPGMQKLLVVENWPPKAEVLDISSNMSSNWHCRFPPDYPGADRGIGGAFLGGMPLVCGGALYTTVPDMMSFGTCYTYESSNNWRRSSQYALLSPRNDFASVQLSDTKWWVVGGEFWAGDGSLGQVQRTTEMFEVDIGFTPFVDLPFTSGWYGLVKVDESHVMMIAGFNRTLMFDLDTLTWTELPNMDEDTSSAAVGLVTYPDGRREVIVTAGSFSSATQIFSLDTQTWRFGPDFPISRNHVAASVPYGDTFLVVGGNSNGGGSLPNDMVFMWDVNYEDWSVIAHMAEVRSGVTAMLLPDDFVTCSDL